MDGKGDFSKEDRSGRNLHFGVRELAMAAIGNGMALHGGLKPYVATFFVFSDYVKPMARLSALMGTPLTYVFTHDSIGVGEDGPTMSYRTAGSSSGNAELPCVPSMRRHRDTGRMVQRCYI